MKKKIVGIFIAMLLIATTTLSVLGTNNHHNDDTFTISASFEMIDVYEEIKQSNDKILCVDELIGQRQVKYWEHVIDDVYVKGDSILLHLDSDTNDIVEYQRIWTDVDIDIIPNVEDTLFESRDYFWKKVVMFPDSDDCIDFYTFTDPVEFPVFCWEVRYTNGETIMYDFDGESIGMGIPTPSCGFTMSGYNNASWPDPYITYRQNAYYWFGKWCTSVYGFSLPQPVTISYYVSNSNFELFYELAHGDSYSFLSSSPGYATDYYYASNPSYYNVQSDLQSRQAMKFAFVGSCQSMVHTGPGTFSHEFRKGQTTGTVVVGFYYMDTCPGWQYEYQWQDLMFNYMDQGYTIKQSFDMATAQYPSLSGCVAFNGDINLQITQGSNQPPNTPSQLSGPSSGNVGDTLTYTSSTTDPDGDNIMYGLDADSDGNVDHWSSNYYPSGSQYTIQITFHSAGTFHLRLKAKDIHGAESGWSSLKTVTIAGGGNNPPNSPSTPTGPTSGNVGVSYSYSSSTTDPDGDQIKYGFDWDGNGAVDDWSGLLNSGTPCSMSHLWTSAGTYQVKVKAQDVHGAESGWSSALTVTISAGNNPPLKPSRPSGQTNGKAGTSYPYSTSTTDPDGNKVKYGWDWNGNSIVDQWDDNNGNYYSSGVTISTFHSWISQGTYNLKVMAEDINGAQSAWSDPLAISMPKNKPNINTPFLSFLENHPHMFPLLRQLLGLQ